MSNDFVFLEVAKIDFKCPFCEKEYNDSDEKYLDRINRNKQGFVTKTCICGERFGIACDMYGPMVSFEL